MTLQTLFRDDVRNGLAAWVMTQRESGKRVFTLSNYSHVTGTELVMSEHDLASADVFVSCNNEFERYFISKQASEIFHAYGGQSRVDFYRDLFAGLSEFQMTIDLQRQEPNTPEIWLSHLGLLRPLDAALAPFVSKRCVGFERRLIGSNPQ
jgi:hypothetical protein